jgi:predicted small secreted protein
MSEVRKDAMRQVWVLIGAMMAVAGCNTFTGIGRDMASVGNWMTDTASDIRGDSRNPNGHVPPPDYTKSPNGY